ncbi:signal transduction histidine kinase [Desulfoscipio gibsoniae DSM 7213]|uniref:histidine kinase n=1 Tax=Desulfoscipio gibsoniae DSM 7213 TaxID=767817 RepID=R4KPG4_9FIRM|nr:signal transduction histidine kinase [Desulfoscipio gibsoniae DSM 7213]
MSLLVNREAKNFLILFSLVLFLGVILFQVIAYIQAVHFRNEMIVHDYEIAGYLKQKHPELAVDIQEAFTADKLPDHLETGKALLEQSGYKNGIQLHLIPQVDKFYRSNKATNLIFSSMFVLVILLVVYLFLKTHYRKIDQYNNDISKIMNGEISTRLDDNEEGNLSKLAASINLLTASLYTHIEKEKQNRVFLKDILTNVSHQLKTPLSALTMYTDIMRNENTDNDVIVKFLDKSEKELERMQTLIANLLKMAKLDAGIIELNKSNHILNDIIKQVAESFETRLSKEQKTWAVKSDCKVAYLCDREWMLEALSNLFKNAVEHTRAGNHISVLIEETPLIIKITFEDNGEGIHPDDINHIFKRFYRSRFSQNKQGTGIGLSLAKTIIEMHGGFISVESTIEKGTKFTVHLPNLQNCKV